jgi:hypothetical protein
MKTSELARLLVKGVMRSGCDADLDVIIDSEQMCGSFETPRDVFNKASKSESYLKFYGRLKTEKEETNDRNN